MIETADCYEVAACDFYTMFELNGIQYLPHYSEPTFVGPGYGRHNWNTFTHDELKAAGAKAGIGYLLLRPHHKTTR